MKSNRVEIDCCYLIVGTKLINQEVLCARKDEFHLKGIKPIMLRMSGPKPTKIT